MAKTNYKKLTAGDITLIMQSSFHTDEVVFALNNAFVKALKKIALKAEGFAKRLCPVDTGRLRKSTLTRTSRYCSKRLMKQPESNKRIQAPPMARKKL